MPEGPEIRLAADEISLVLKGRKTIAVFFAHECLQKYEKKLTGLKVIDVQTRGKAMLTLFEDDWVVYSHNQLYGRWLTINKGEIPDTNRQLRFAIHNRKASALLYSASDIEVLKSSQLHQHPFLARIGPDLLSETPSVTALTDRLQEPRFRNKQLAGLLLDQSFVAGLGNYLRAEILLASGLHPVTKPSQCSRSMLRKLATQIIRITQRSYKTKGIVNSPQLVKMLKRSGKVTKESHRFSVYDRGGESCYHCPETIQRMNAGGRHIYFCPGCQPAIER
ncbi:MAG: endonuclease VIII [Granulosicoccus sp.]|nr:endonuclease VIII [Granulosicoccus sp.]